MNQHKIFKESENRLKSLIGRNIQLIYLDGVIKTCEEVFIESKGLFFSLREESKFLCIKLNWFESSLSTYDLYEFEVSIKNKLPIKSGSSILTFNDTATIKNIDIYQSTVKLEDEMIVFDSALYFRRTDGKSIFVTGAESALQNIKIYSNSQDINQVIKSFSLRNTIKEGVAEGQKGQGELY